MSSFSVLFRTRFGRSLLPDFTRLPVADVVVCMIWIRSDLMVLAFTLCLASNGLLAGFMVYHYCITNRLASDIAEFNQTINDQCSTDSAWLTALRMMRLSWSRHDQLQFKLFALSFGLSIYAFWQKEPISFGVVISSFVLATLWGLHIAAVAPTQQQLIALHDRLTPSRTKPTAAAGAGAGAAIEQPNSIDIRLLLRSYNRYYTACTVLAVASFACLCLADSDFR